MRPSFKAFHFLQHWVYLLRSDDIVVHVNNAVCFGPDTDSAGNGIGKLMFRKQLIVQVSFHLLPRDLNLQRVPLFCRRGRVA